MFSLIRIFSPINPAMNWYKTGSFFYLLFLFSLFACSDDKTIYIITRDNDSSRIEFGKTHLVEALREQGYEVNFSTNYDPNLSPPSILISLNSDELISGQEWIIKNENKEGYSIQSKDDLSVIAGHDPSGVLYACLDLADRIKEKGKIPEALQLSEQPEMVLRGTCIGLQKTEYLPGREVYEYPYTPENFSWFYDKELWIKYLDMMVENRFNSLYLWNGHPFASLVRLPEYPYAVEVDEATFAKNEEIFSFLTQEADKRGIWVIQMFYNIIVSQPFAEQHEIATQDRSRPILPVVADYTRKSVAAFIEKYPNVGLMVCLGEAMNTIEDDVEWFTQTIIPGVKDGLQRLKITEEPPIVLRGHDTDPKLVMDEALKIYQNLYTTAKYNGESLTTYEPRKSWVDVHQALSSLGSVHISNVHILANLEPFRYGSPDFIQKSTQAMHDLQGANGLHLYPQASYWDWPYSADKTEPRLLEMERDWIWYAAWGRYAWDCRQDKVEEGAYWSNRLAHFYGCEDYGKDILTAYQEMGEIAPKLLRRYGISDGNRQTLLLGMFMSQLVNPNKWHVYQSFIESNGPEGETLIAFARKEAAGETHKGELPLEIAEEVKAHAQKAVEAIDRVAPHVKANNEEFARLKNDVYCYKAIAEFFYEKVHAALEVLRYKYNSDVANLEKASSHLEKSLTHYSELVELTRESYLYANSMQTQQRRVPISGRDGTNKTWAELLVHYQNEYENFERNIESLKSKGDGASAQSHPVLEPASIMVKSKHFGPYSLKAGEKIYADQEYKILEVAPELGQLKGFRFSDQEQQETGTTFSFSNQDTVKIVVGYFNTNSYTTLRPPTLETNASANNRGQADIKIANALRLDGLYPVNVYTYTYEPGVHDLSLGKGRVLILGVMKGGTDIKMHDAGITDKQDGAPVDWLFY